MLNLFCWYFSLYFHIFFFFSFFLYLLSHKFIFFHKYLFPINIAWTLNINKAFVVIWIRFWLNDWLNKYLLMMPCIYLWENDCEGSKDDGWGCIGGLDKLFFNKVKFYRIFCRFEICWEFKIKKIKFFELIEVVH